MANNYPSNSPLWIQKRVLAFLNSVIDAKTLVEGIEDSPNNGQGYGLGLTVAQRILDRRNALPGQRFRELSQLGDIEGLGEDKWDDLMHSHGQLSAEDFRESLFEKKLLYDNWEIEHFTTQIPDINQFRLIVGKEESLQAFVAEQIGKIIFKQHSNRVLTNLTVENLRNSYVDFYPEGFLGSYAWALWFFCFDADNWFSFEQIREAIESYLNTFSGISEEIGLYLFKGFINMGTLSEGVSVNDLPVTVSYAEQSISIWSVSLFD